MVNPEQVEMRPKRGREVGFEDGEEFCRQWRLVLGTCRLPRII